MITLNPDSLFWRTYHDRFGMRLPKSLCGLVWVIIFAALGITAGIGIIGIMLGGLYQAVFEGNTFWTSMYVSALFFVAGFFGIRAILAYRERKQWQIVEAWFYSEKFDNYWHYTMSKEEKDKYLEWTSNRREVQYYYNKWWNMIDKPAKPPSIGKKISVHLANAALLTQDVFNALTNKACVPVQWVNDEASKRNNDSGDEASA